MNEEPATNSTIGSDNMWAERPLPKGAVGFGIAAPNRNSARSLRMGTGGRQPDGSGTAARTKAKRQKGSAVVRGIPPRPEMV